MLIYMANRKPLPYSEDLDPNSREALLHCRYVRNYTPRPDDDGRRSSWSEHTPIPMATWSEHFCKSVHFLNILKHSFNSFVPAFPESLEGLILCTGLAKIAVCKELNMLRKYERNVISITLNTSSPKLRIIISLTV